MSIKLKQLLSQIPEDTESRVDRIRKRINSQVRDPIRRETGLTLNRQQERKPEPQSENIIVPVVLVAGLPEILQKVEFEDAQVLKILLSPYRRFIYGAKEDLNILLPVLSQIEAIPAGKNLLLNRSSGVVGTHDLLVELLKLLDEKNPVDKILEVSEDVLGVYRCVLPRQPKDLFVPQKDTFEGTIELYWGVIGLVAGMLGVEIEALTTVVLIHELGHAYTHLGADIDGRRWSTIGFSKSGTGLKEGLAQYYTLLVSLRLENQVPGVVGAFEELLKHQPVAYHAHEPVVKGYTPEEVRLALLDVRRRGASSLNEFEESLTEARKRLRTFDTAH